MIYKCYYLPERIYTMDISYELYKVFYYVAATLSFSEASKKLYISQSAVSQSIKTLEKKLGQSLFIRNTKKVLLTPEGEVLFRHIEPAINLIQKGEEQLTEPNQLGGQLRIGASDTICRYFLVPYLNRFHKEFPEIHIKVMNQTSVGCVDLLESGQVDIIVSNYPNIRLKGYGTLKMIKKFQDVFVGNQAYFNYRGRSLSFWELQKLPLLMLDRKSTTSEFLHNLFSRHNLNLVPEVELSSNDLLIDLARIGLGIAFVPDYALPDDNNLYRLKLEETLPSRYLALATNDQIPPSIAVQKFIQYFDKP